MHRRPPNHRLSEGKWIFDQREERCRGCEGGFKKMRRLKNKYRHSKHLGPTFYIVTNSLLVSTETQS
jgi:hypothetical protein